uniref:Uncharacterized protein n=1 Tax=Rhizophora mucronata TaxID=61149 RepID=A0A2P2IVC3_RHIMU
MCKIVLLKQKILKKRAHSTKYNHLLLVFVCIYSRSNAT